MSVEQVNGVKTSTATRTEKKKISCQLLPTFLKIEINKTRTEK
jgi:hypothetical protein